MDSRTTIYIDKDCLEKIAFLSIEKALPNLFTLFKRYCDICTNIEDSFYDEDIEDPVSQLFNGNDIRRPNDLSDFFDELNSDETLYGEKANDIFVLNKDKSDIQKIRDKYAVWIFGIDEIEDKMFRCLNYQKSFDKGECMTWQNIFMDATQKSYLPPSSCAVITDHYLIKNDFGGKIIGLCNVESIFENIIPEKSRKYTILMFFKNTEKLQQESKLKEWIKVIKQKYEKKHININVIAINLPDKIPHKRLFFTNYYWIEADRGFSLIKGEKINEDNELYIKTYTTEDLDRTGDGNKEKCLKPMKQLIDLYNSALENIANNQYLPRIISDMPIEQIKELEINLF